MSTEITMPKLSDTMEEGKILRWLKHPGDKIKHGDALAEVETDKADMVLESFEDGVLQEIKLQEGESAPVGAVIALMAPQGGAAVKPAATPSEQPAPSAAAQSGNDAESPARSEAHAQPPGPRPVQKAERPKPTPIGNGAQPADSSDSSENHPELAAMPSAAPSARLAAVRRPVEQIHEAPAEAHGKFKVSPLAR